MMLPSTEKMAENSLVISSMLLFLSDVIVEKNRHVSNMELILETKD